MVVTDPGRALITGKWKDVGRFKGPMLRGLAGRAPYFHNGSAASLLDAVNFYDVRFGLGLTDEQKSDLVAFLRTLYRRLRPNRHPPARDTLRHAATAAACRHNQRGSRPA